MTETYPDYITYQQLYQRFYEGRPSTELLELLGPIAGKHIVDLCGGDGRLTTAALNFGAGCVTLVDAAAAMVAPALWHEPRVHICINHVREWLAQCQANGNRFDGIACQQAVNYWLDGETAPLIAAALVPAGTFTFNTFHQQPTRTPTVKQYQLDGHTFAEVSWLVGDIVHHLQVRDGLTPHYTSFRWLPHELLLGLLEPHFTVTIQQRGNTALYQCIKK